MAINNNTNNKIEEDNIIFAVQGAKSFLKCKMDWAGIGKLHVRLSRTRVLKADASSWVISKRHCRLMVKTERLHWVR